jgi:pimeloyl-ACP methyl ester carboxylesterase
LEQEGLEHFLAQWQAQPLFATQQRLSSQRLDAQRQLRMKHRAEDLAGALQRLGLGQMPDYGAGLTEIAVPVQLVFGDLDAKFAALAAQMASALPRAVLVALPGIGHNPVLECPEQLGSLLKRGIDA